MVSSNAPPELLHLTFEVSSHGSVAVSIQLNVVTPGVSGPGLPIQSGGRSSRRLPILEGSVSTILFQPYDPQD
jgi:hypothetical protein